VTSFAVLAVGVAIVWLVFWTIKNEKARTLDEQTGLFRVRNWTAEQRKAEEEEESRKKRVSKRSPLREDKAEAEAAGTPNTAKASTSPKTSRLKRARGAAAGPDAAGPGGSGTEKPGARPAGSLAARRRPRRPDRPE
jgi:hypothetical protein